MSFTVSIKEIIEKDKSGLLGIHESWIRIPLSEAGKILNGFAFSSSKFTKEKNGMPLLRIRDILKGNTDSFYVGEYDDLYIVKENDLIVGMDGDFNCTLWKGKDALLNQRVCKITPEEHIYRKKLLFYVLPGYLNAINANTSSVTVKHLSSFTIAEIPLPYPPIDEQDRIVAEIEKQFSRLDAGVAALERIRVNLKRYRAAVLKAACEGRLVPQDPADEPASELLKRILKERRARWEAAQLAAMKAKGVKPKDDKWKSKYTEPAPPDTSNLPKLPKGWTWARAEQVCEFITKGTTPESKKMTQRNGEIPYIKVYNLTNNGTLDFSVNPTFIDKTTHEKELGRSRVYPGDVLMNIVGPPLGKVSIVPDDFSEWNINQAIAIFRPVAGLNNQYLCRYLLLVEKVLIITGLKPKSTAGQSNLTLEICRDLPIPIPPEKEQGRIVEATDEQWSIIDGIAETISRSMIRADRLRQSILKQAFSGKLVPQDPDDEPTNNNLEKIRFAHR